MTFEHLKELIDVLISDYNGKPHGGIYHQTPLELLGKRMGAGLLPRLLEEEKRREVLFMQTTLSRTIRGSVKSGKKPYIQFEGVEYRSEKLAHSAHLINKELVIHVNVDDLRTIRAFLSDGSEFDYLTAAGKWSITPHTLQTRKAINSLVRRRLVYLTTWDDPLFIYTEYLMKNAANGKRGAANKVTQVRESTKQKRKTVNEPEGHTIALEEAEKQNSALDRAREIAKKEQIEKEFEEYKDLMEKSKIRRLVLIIDEAHRLTEFHYSWLMDIYNALVQKKVSMTVISVGYQVLVNRHICNDICTKYEFCEYV